MFRSYIVREYLILIVIAIGAVLIWRGLSNNIARGGWSGEPVISRSVYAVAGVLIVLLALAFLAFIRGAFGFLELSEPLK